MKIGHLIFTSFGVGMYDELWMLYRLELIRNTVVPSMAAQTSQEFQWIIFVDQDITPIVECQLRTALNAVSNHEVVKLGKYHDRMPRARELAVTYGAGCDFLIQSRIDDDDAMHIRAVHEIREKARAMIEAEHCIGTIALDGGFDYLCESAHVCRNERSNLAIGLSIFHPTGREYGIFDYSHDTIAIDLQRDNEAAGRATIKLSDGGYLYTKHSLSDSSYFGMRGRMLGAGDLVSYDAGDDFWRAFGIDAVNVEHLKKVFSTAPVSFPHPAINVTYGLDVYAERNVEISRKKKHVMRNMLRARLRQDGVHVMCVGDLATELGNRATHRFFKGTTETITVEAFMRKDAIFYGDILVIDQIVLCDIAEAHDVEEIAARLCVVESHIHYLLIARWNASNHLQNEQYARLFGLLEKRLLKVQEIGGWDVDVNNENRVETIVDATAELIARNAI